VTPVRLGLLAASILALATSVYLVFVAGLGNDPAATPVAQLPSALPSAGQPTLRPGEPTPLASGLPRSSDEPRTPDPAATPANPLAKQPPPRSADPGDLTGYVWPVRNARLTSHFAPREPALGGFVLINGQAYHDGTDLATRCGDEVLAAHDGAVLYAGRNFDPYLGYQGDASAIYARLEQIGRTNSQPIVVVIDDGNGYRSVYVHLQRADVEAGDVVDAGEVIGLQGATGFATGCHLHYTLIRMDGAWQQVVPRLYRFGYPELVRERINPVDVLAWDDEFAPDRLRNRVSPSPSASPS
jgi:murein DD-endopeptidase MepM/ murein hydrolase activator NlpD